jgi:hypothetical protein
MYHFQITVQKRPESIGFGDALELDGRICTPLSGSGLQTPVPIPVSFEQAADRLQELPRMFFEPDGSFVWVGEERGQHWQVDGQVTDRDGRLLYADLKGTCPSNQFDQLLAALGWPAVPLVFQLTRHAVFLDEADFRRFADSATRKAK